MMNLDAQQRASQRALALGRGLFRARIVSNAFQWTGWSEALPPRDIKRFCVGRSPLHTECGHPLSEHGWLAASSLVCPGAWVALEAGQARLLDQPPSPSNVVSAMRWGHWDRDFPLIKRLQTDAPEHHLVCGFPLQEHGLSVTGLVCPGDWVITGSGPMLVLRPAAFFSSYEAVGADSA